MPKVRSYRYLREFKCRYCGSVVYRLSYWAKGNFLCSKRSCVEARKNEKRKRY